MSSCIVCMLLRCIKYMRGRLLWLMIPASVTWEVGELCRNCGADWCPVCGGDSWEPKKHCIRPRLYMPSWWWGRGFDVAFVKLIWTLVFIVVSLLHLGTFTPIKTCKQCVCMHVQVLYHGWSRWHLLVQSWYLRTSLEKHSFTGTMLPRMLTSNCCLI